jgi:hypothetical protein
VTACRNFRSLKFTEPSESHSAAMKYATIRFGEMKSHDGAGELAETCGVVLSYPPTLRTVLTRLPTFVR